MAKKIKCVLLRGKFSKPIGGGERELLLPGDEVSLTVDQYTSFKDQFETVAERDARAKVAKATAEALEDDDDVKAKAKADAEAEKERKREEAEAEEKAEADKAKADLKAKEEAEEAEEKAAAKPTTPPAPGAKTGGNVKSAPNSSSTKNAGQK